MHFQGLFEAVKHTDALLVAIAVSAVRGLIYVPLEFGHEQVMYRLARLAPASIDALDLVADMPVVMFLGQLGWRAV